MREIDLGLVAYPETEAMQRDLVEQRKQDQIPDTLLLVRHPEVITLGRGADRRFLLSDRLPVVESVRGGQVTYHGPGQLVAYPVLRLQGNDLHAYLRDLEEVVIALAAGHGLRAGREEGRTGVWVEGRKLASIGIRAARHRGRWYVSHGVAVNLEADLSGFEAIVPCGLEGVEMTSLERLVGPVDRNLVQQEFVRHFRRILDIKE